MVFFDLISAFDSLDGGVVALHLDMMEIRSYVVNWKVSLPREREDVGVTQSSVLWPLIFSLLANNIPTFMQPSKLIPFADNTTAVVTAASLELIQTAVLETMSAMKR